MNGAQPEGGGVAEAVAGLAAAERDGDRGVLEGMLAQGFSAVRVDGAVVSRAAFLDRAKGRPRLGALDRTDIDVQVAGDVAVATCLERVRTPAGGATSGERLRARLVLVRVDGAWRLLSLSRVTDVAGDLSGRRRVLALIAWLTAAAAFFFLLVASLHFGARIPLGVATLAQGQSRYAAIAEALIGVVLGLATVALVAHGHCAHAWIARRWAARADMFAVFGTFVGLLIVSGGSGPSVHTEVVEHVVMLALVVPGLVLLESPLGRWAVRPDAVAEL
jgi:hypothetical protein